MPDRIPISARIIQTVLFGGMAMYMIAAGAALIIGMKQSVSSSCCLPPVSTCGRVSTNFPTNIYTSDSLPGICDISFVDGQSADETAAGLNCPAAANLTQCDEGVSSPKLCDAQGGRGVILAAAIIAIILGSFMGLYALIAVVIFGLSIRSFAAVLFSGSCGVLVFNLCIFSPIALHRIFVSGSSTQEAVVCDLYVSDICVSYTKAEFKKSEKIGNTCPWEGKVANVLDMITNTGAMRRPVFAIMVASYVLLLLIIVWLIVLCARLCCDATGDRWHNWAVGFLRFLDGEGCAGFSSHSHSSSSSASYRAAPEFDTNNINNSTSAVPASRAAASTAAVLDDLSSGPAQEHRRQPDDGEES